MLLPEPAEDFASPTFWISKWSMEFLHHWERISIRSSGMRSAARSQDALQPHSGCSASRHYISTTAIPDATARHQVIIGADGWLDEVRRIDSPNFDARPPGSSIELIVIHNISLPPGSYGGGHIERLFTNALDVSADPFFAQIVGARVSAHILIDRDGTTAQFVSFTQRAWHAGTFGIQRSYPLQRFFDRIEPKEPISNRLPTPNTAR